MPTFLEDFETPAIQERIDQDTRQYRTGDCVLTLVNADGQPLPSIRVQVKQIRSRFLFGANIFMLDGFGTDELNRTYEERFTRVFNAATVPFYWRDLEPEAGHLRFPVDSTPVSRRPPPDRVVSFCDTHGLNMNGHCLVWDNTRWSIPEWLTDSRHCGPVLERRIREIATRYGNRIPRWDVVNEAAGPRHAGLTPLPEGYEELAFTTAAEVYPESAHLMINDTTGAAWSPRDRHHYHTLIRHLLDKGCRIDGIGLQWHRFNAEEVRKFDEGLELTATEQFEALDEYRGYGRPLHVSEITLPEKPDSEEGREWQARHAEALYRLWFSHPDVHAITWWNVPDGCAAPGENVVASGLLDADLEPKPAYDALHRLITREWRTSTSGDTGADGTFSFRGYHGTYQVQLPDGRIQEFELSPDSGNIHTVSMG